MKASRLNILALVAGLATLATFPAAPAMADDKNAAPSTSLSGPAGKTRAEVRAEYLQARREARLPNISEIDETSYSAVSGSPVRRMTRETAHARNVRPGRLPSTDMDPK